MKTDELKEILRTQGFNEEKQDTGYRYTIHDEHVELEIYVEPGIEIEFISRYKWNRNDVKGTYNLSAKELEYSKDSASTLLKKTLNNMPEYIGTEVNAHKVVRNFIDSVFGKFVS